MTAAKLRELIARATKGPWEARGVEKCGYGWINAPEGVRDTFGKQRQILSGQYGQMSADAEICAHLRNNAPAIADLIEAADAYLVANINFRLANTEREYAAALELSEAERLLRKALEKLGYESVDFCECLFQSLPRKMDIDPDI